MTVPRSSAEVHHLRESTGMNSAELEELRDRLHRVNQSRRQGAIDGERARLERQIEVEYRASRKLAVYGSLAPGRSNHRVVARLEGRWTEAQVHGDLLDRGWGAGLGFPAMRWRPRGGAIDVHLLESSHLSDHWDEIDRFEGSGYVRILVPYYRAGKFTGVANIYELAPGGEDDSQAAGNLTTRDR